MAAKAPTRKDVPLREPEPKVWTFPGLQGSDGEPVQYVQDRLTFFEKNELIALFTQVVDDAIRDGMDIAQLFASFTGTDGDMQSALGDLQNGVIQIKAIPQMTQILQLMLAFVSKSAPKLESLYMIALSIEPENRPWFRQYLRQIDDDTAFGIWDTFVKQNAHHIAAFLPRLRAQFEDTIQAVRSARSEESSDS